MKLIATAFLIASLAESALPQSTAAPTNSVQAVEIKHDKKEQKAKAKTQREAEKSQTGIRVRRQRPPRTPHMQRSIRLEFPSNRCPRRFTL
jgi:nitrate reductase cytochrome c-type subunit